MPFDFIDKRHRLSIAYDSKEDFLKDIPLHSVDNARQYLDKMKDYDIVKDGSHDVRYDNEEGNYEVFSRHLRGIRPNYKTGSRKIHNSVELMRDANQTMYEQQNIFRHPSLRPNVAHYIKKEEDTLKKFQEMMHPVKPVDPTTLSESHQQKSKSHEKSKSTHPSSGPTPTHNNTSTHPSSGHPPTPTPSPEKSKITSLLGGPKKGAPTAGSVTSTQSSGAPTHKQSGVGDDPTKYWGYMTQAQAYYDDPDLLTADADEYVDQLLSHIPNKMIRDLIKSGAKQGVKNGINMIKNKMK